MEELRDDQTKQAIRRDINDALVEKVVAYYAPEYSELIHNLVSYSRLILGFFPGQASYLINYSWIFTRLLSHSRRSAVLDAGTGISLLPFLLSEKGYKLTTVDNSHIERSLPLTPDSNEWGYLDYGRYNSKLTSFRESIQQHLAFNSYDVVYSICVISHVPAIERRDIFKAVAKCLTLNGRFYLALDLIPGSDFIWNYSAGTQVESPFEHGTIYDVFDELTQHKFSILGKQLVRSLPDSLTDQLLIEASANI